MALPALAEVWVANVICDSPAWRAASMTVTTVGSNIVPETTLGKVCTALLATCGMTIFPIFTVYITSLVQRMNQSR